MYTYQSIDNMENMVFSQLFWKIVFLETLTCVAVTGLTLTSVEDCPKFKADKDDVRVKLYDNICYYFHMSEVVTFGDAETTCLHRGGRMAMPQSRNVNDFLSRELSSYKSDTGTWVGLYLGKKDNSIRYFWTTGSNLNPTEAQNILKYAKGLELKYENGYWNIVKSSWDPTFKNHFVCQITKYDIKYVTHKPTPTIPTATTPTTTITNTPSTTTTTKIGQEPNAKATLETLFCPQIPSGQQYMRFFGDLCFYFQLNMLADYKNAKNSCKNYGGTLALVKTAVIEEFLQYTLRYDFKVPIYSTWIGLETEPDHGHYLWQDGSHVTYTNFRFSFPVYDRFAMSGLDDKWESYSNKSYRNFICQFKSVVNSLSPSV